MKIREEEINKYSKERIEIVEDGGVKMKNMLGKKDPFPSIKCDKKVCIVCESKISKNQTSCNTNNIGYQLACDTCRERGIEQVYEGESSRSARIRGGEHYRDWKYSKSTGVLYKHKQNDHQNEEMKISMKIIKKFKDPLTRQANEAVRINNRKNDEILNSKSEFNHPPVARITVEGKQKFRKSKNELNIQYSQACTQSQNSLSFPVQKIQCCSKHDLTFSS